MFEFIIHEFQPLIFILTFSVSQLISTKFPEIKFYLMRRTKKFRVHHAFAGGLLALFASLTGHSLLFNLGFGGMLQDIFTHTLNILRKYFK